MGEREVVRELEQLYRQRYRRFLRLALAVVGGHDAAADAVQEAFVRRAAVAELPSRQREVLFLRHYADLEYEQIAEVLGIARGTVAATLNHAHDALRKTMEVPR